MKTFCFIFARGGSKGLPGKNIKNLGGVPLIAHSINLARDMEEIDDVFVSSDSEEILEIAQESGAKKILRPQELSTDKASEWMAWRHGIEDIISKYGEFDLFLSLPATAPLRDKSDVKNCFSAMDQQTDIVITVTPAIRSPHFNMIYRDESGRSKIILNDSKAIRRQDAPKVYDITTVAYLSRPDFILANEGIFSGKVKSVIIPKERAIDIDDEIDFWVAEKIYERNNKP